MHFQTKSYRDDHARAVIYAYMNDDWDEDGTEVVAGKLTHTTQMTNRVERPGIIDEGDYDQDGQYWDPDCAYRCNYELLKLDVPITSYDQAREGMCDNPDCVSCDPMPDD